MVLRGQLRGRVGRRRSILHKKAGKKLTFPAFLFPSSALREKSQESAASGPFPIPWPIVTPKCIQSFLPFALPQHRNLLSLLIAPHWNEILDQLQGACYLKALAKQFQGAIDFFQFLSARNPRMGGCAREGYRRLCESPES
jgi:hypothetical protein